MVADAIPDKWLRKFKAVLSELNIERAVPLIVAIISPGLTAEPSFIWFSKIIFSLIPYIENHVQNGGKTWDICKHLINLVENIPKAKIWRNKVSTKSIKKELNIDYLVKITSELREMGY